MTSFNFDTVVEDRVQKIAKILSHKAREYAADEDRFHNFNTAARIDNTYPERALKGMWMKHLVSVFDLIDWAEAASHKITGELIDEKIGDAINYLILLEGMLLQRKETEKIRMEKRRKG